MGNGDSQASQASEPQALAGGETPLLLRGRYEATVAWVKVLRPPYKSWLPKSLAVLEPKQTTKNFNLTVDDESSLPEFLICLKSLPQFSGDRLLVWIQPKTVQL